MGRQPSPLDVDDLLAEILLRLPALPSSLPRASLVCTRWRRMVTDPDFLRRFRARQWKPIGVFSTSSQSGRQDISFSFLSDQLGSIPPERFSVSVRCEGAGGGGDDCAWEFQGCRHGLVLLINRTRYGIRQMLVWNPVTGEQHLLGVPDFSDPSWNRPPFNMSGAVICPFGDKGPFKVAVAWNGSPHMSAFTRPRPVYGVMSSPQQCSLNLCSLLVLEMSSLGILFTGFYLAVSFASLKLIWVEGT